MQWPTAGRAQAEIGRTKSGDAVLDDSPNTVASSTVGRPYAASAWVMAPAGRSVTLRIREYRGTRVVQARIAVSTGTGAWQQLTVTSAPAAGGTSVSVDALVSLLPTNLRARLDDVALRRA